MTNEQFIIEVENSFKRSKKILSMKELEYSLGKDRLNQFYRAGALQNIEPTEALMGMVAKHITSIADMCKCPANYTLPQWNEKITDLRNYTFLLDALVRDLGGKDCDL